MAEKRSFRKRLKAWVIGGIGGGLAAVVAFGMAVMDARPKSIPKLDPSQPFETGQWQATAFGAYVATQAVYGYPLRDRRAVVLEVQLTNRTADTSGDYGSLFEPNIALETADRRPIVVLTRNVTGKTSPALQPGLGERLAFIWQLPKTGPSPTELELIVHTKHYKAQDNLRGKPGWFNQEPVAKLAMAVAANDGRTAP